MKVELIAHTPDPEGVVAGAARTCYMAPPGDDAKTINGLVSRGHLSPIEHASFTFKVSGVSRALLAQITRHRIASYSVKSQRYVSEESAARGGGVFGYVVPPRIAALGPEHVEEFHSQMRQIQGWYDHWVSVLGGGRDAYEDARYVLPNAAETEFVVTMNARELLHFFTLRCCSRAQWEIRALANEMLRLVKGTAPNIFAKAGPACLRGPCPEGAGGCGKGGGGQ